MPKAWHLKIESPRSKKGAVSEIRVLGIRKPATRMLKASNSKVSGIRKPETRMLKASNLKAPGFSLGFGICNPLRAESTPETEVIRIPNHPVSSSHR